MTTVNPWVLTFYSPLGSRSTDNCFSAAARLTFFRNTFVFSQHFNACLNVEISRKKRRNLWYPSMVWKWKIWRAVCLLNIVLHCLTPTLAGMWWNQRQPFCVFILTSTLSLLGLTFFMLLTGFVWDMLCIHSNSCMSMAWGVAIIA